MFWKLGTAGGSSSFGSSMGASWGPGGKNAWTEKVGEDARHLQVIRDVNLKVVKLKRMRGRKRCDGEGEKNQKGSRETQTRTNSERERRAQTRHVPPVKYYCSSSRRIYTFVFPCNYRAKLFASHAITSCTAH